ncbi:S66 family peptidase [Herbinix luporum]|uniref:S66 family peptidase n=1 Tax=Herbinix luporum TaxID=1679721 RepID=UPI0023EFEC89|nr:S66 peptidase family protein [Herbinix luporum]
MIYPVNLEKGNCIGVTATSAGFDGETDYRRLDNAISHFKRLGYYVITTPNVKTCHKGRSGHGKTRAEELMELYKDPKVRVIFAASGGDFLVEMLPYIDFNLILDTPKWIQGFSDTTGLNFTITTNLDIATIYSYNFSTFGMAKWHKSLSNNILILEGNDILQESFDLYQDGYYKRITGLEEFVLEREVQWKNILPSGSNDNKEIHIKGRLLGGCLDCLLNLVGTRFDKTKEFVEKYREDGILWFLESYDLNSAALIRGLWQLKEAGWFKNAVGFIFGRPAMYDNIFDISYEEAISSVLGELGLPIIMEADIGHKHPQFTMINGAIATVKAYNNKGNIIFERR